MENLFPIVFLALPLFMFSYWNYIALFEPERFRRTLQEWTRQNEQIRQVVGKRWWPLELQEDVIRGTLFLGLLVNLLLLAESILQL